MGMAGLNLDGQPSSLSFSSLPSACVFPGCLLDQVSSPSKKIKFYSEFGCVEEAEEEKHELAVHFLWNVSFFYRGGGLPKTAGPIKQPDPLPQPAPAPMPATPIAQVAQLVSFLTHLIDYDYSCNVHAVT